MPTHPSSKPVSLAKSRPTSPLPPPLPPKAIDLNNSTRSTDNETGQKFTRRAFLCDVVVEREGGGSSSMAGRLVRRSWTHAETSNFISHLGRSFLPLSTLPPPPLPSTISRPTTPSRLTLPPDSNEGRVPLSDWSEAEQEEMSRRLAQLLKELVNTERSYLSRIRALKEARGTSSAISI